MLRNTDDSNRIIVKNSTLTLILKFFIFIYHPVSNLISIPCMINTITNSISIGLYLNNVVILQKTAANNIDTRRLTE